MRNFILAFICCLCSFCSLAQVNKLPTYALRQSYMIDKMKDTLAPKAGGTVKYNYYIYNDSVIFHYNNTKQLEIEQIYRTAILNADPEYPDTSRFYRKYLYDSKGRVISIRHIRIIGSSNPSSPYYDDGYYYYGVRKSHHSVQRIDSMAYDNHDKQIFYRRYEPFNFDNRNYTMVIKEGWENEYVYDNLGRLSLEDRYYWTQNTKYRVFEYTADPTTHKYNYVGNTTQIKSRIYNGSTPYRAGSCAPSIDSLITYDNKGRITSWKSFPYYTAQNGLDYTKASRFDTIIYYDQTESREYNGASPGTVLSFDSKNACMGIKYDVKGRLRFIYNGTLIDKTNYGQYTKCQNSQFTLTSQSRIHHYTDDSEGNLLAVDSAYNKREFISGYTTNGTTIYFDTIAYYGFKLIDEPVTSVNDLLNENIVNIYPNPASEYITVLTNGLPGVLHIYGTDGLCCISENVIEKNTTIDISKIQTGIYILELNGHRKKLIKY